MQLLRQEPGAGPQAHRGPGRLHLRRVHQPLPGDHRRGDAGGAARQAAGRQAAEPAGHQDRPGRLRDQPGEGQEGPLRGGPQPLQARQRRPPDRRRRAAEVEHPARRAHRLGQDAAGPDAGQGPGRAVLHRRRHVADRGRLCRRGCREHPAAPDPVRRFRRRHAPSAASSTSTRSTRSPARRTTPRSPATSPARASSRLCSRSWKALWPTCRRRAAASIPTRTSSRSTPPTSSSSAAAPSTAWTRSSRSGWGSGRWASAPRITCRRSTASGSSSA